MRAGPVTAGEVIDLATAAREVRRRLEPDLIGLYETPEVFDALVALERLLGAGEADSGRSGTRRCARTRRSSPSSTSTP